MLGKVLLRLVSAIPTLFGVVLATFLLTRVLPGDPAVFFAANPSMTADDIEALRQSLGLDKSLIQQFFIYLGDLMRGDLGQSITTGRSVVEELLARLPASAELTFLAFGMAIVIAIPLGVMAALRPGSMLDHTSRLLATAGVSLPTFVAGLLLIYVFYFQLGWAPEPIGRLDPFMFAPDPITGFLVLDSLIVGDLEVAWSAFTQMILPAVTMALFALAPLTRMTRASMIGALGSEFVRSARANGLRRRKVIWTYAFRSALLPIVTSLGMTFSYMLGANVLVERVFAWPGVGAMAMESIINLDYAPLQGFMLLMAAIFILVNLTTDVISGLIDPRAAK